METVVGQRSGQPAGADGRSSQRLVTAGGYLLLLVLGALQGLVGTFQYSRALGPVPVAAVGFAVLIGLTSAAAAWGLHRPLAGLLCAVGWFIATFVLAMTGPGGSVLITNSSAGDWYLFGGSICAAAGVVVGFVCWSPRLAAVRTSSERAHPSVPRGGNGSSAANVARLAKPELDAPGSEAPKPEP